MPLHKVEQDSSIQGMLPIYVMAVAHGGIKVNHGMANNDCSLVGGPGAEPRR